MYAMEEAARLAADFLRRESVGWENEVALFEGSKSRAKKGEFFYFTFQSVKYIATRDDSHWLYGPCHISVHSVTGECRFLSPQESWAVNPFSS